MTNPYKSAATSNFKLSGSNSIDSLLTEEYNKPYSGKWGGDLGTGATLTFSFPWTNSSNPVWQSGYDSSLSGAQHGGFNNTLQTATRLAIQQWANVANLNFTEISESQTDVGDLRFAYSLALASSVWGYSYYPSSYWASAGDVWINSTIASSTDWTLGSYNLIALMHEIGHGLGLKHPGDYNGSGSGAGPFLPQVLDNRVETIMSYTDYRQWFWDNNKQQYQSIYSQTPMVLDIQAIQYLYGANTSYHTENNIYYFTPDKPFYETLWDAGGIDCLDVSGFQLNCTIDLLPGSYSSLLFRSTTSDTRIYTGENDLGIAYGCMIENVVGGNGSDTITGNDLDNTITGNTGDDTIDGGEGIDTAVYSGNRNNYLISYNESNASYSIIDNKNQDGSDTLKHIEYFQFGDGTLNALTLIDHTSPTIITFSPSEGEATLSSQPLITLTFSETIVKGSSAVEIRSDSATGSLIERLEIRNNTRISLSDTQLIIQPEQLLPGGHDYYVVLAAGLVTDLADNAFAGTTSYSFMVLNHAPSGTDNSPTILEDSTYTFAVSDFGFSDNADNHAFAAVKITSLPSAGTLFFKQQPLNNTQISAGYEISVADLALGQLQFQPDTNANGKNYSQFSFQVRDNGGTHNGGIDLDPSPKRFNFSVTPVNDSPSGVVTISGNPVQDQILQVNNNFTDADGITEIFYQWLRDDQPISGEQEVLYKPAPQDIAHRLSVYVYYTDHDGTTEKLSSQDQLFVFPKTSITVNTGETRIRGTKKADVFDSNLYPRAELLGGLGDDSYIVHASNTKISETANAGMDSVYTEVGYSLGLNIENLLSSSNDSLTLTGNNSNNLIQGSSGNDTISGLMGNDTLIGGEGRDTFVFSTTPNSKSNLDKVNDFNVGEDFIGLKTNIFQKIGPSIETSELGFIESGSNQTMNEYILYNPNTGYLSYDKDASGPAQAIPVAIIGMHLALSIHNFVIL